MALPSALLPSLVPFSSSSSSTYSSFSPSNLMSSAGSRLLCGTVINGAMGERVGQRQASSRSPGFGRGRRSGLFNVGEKLRVMWSFYAKAAEGKYEAPFFPVSCLIALGH